MNATLSTTFAVSDVTRSRTPLLTVPYRQSIANLLTGGASSIEACSRYHGKLAEGVFYHPVVAAAHGAFSYHMPLVLSPDAIWLMIVQAVAHHVNANAELLRPSLVRHEGKAEISIRRDEFLKGSPENPWAEAISELSDQVRDHIGPAADRFVPSFSTTGPTEKVAAQIALLDAMKCYFSYSVHSYCGIPEITLEGTPEDWESLAARARGFADLGLGHWLGIVNRILEQFVLASLGDVDLPFWRSLYKYNEVSGGARITGWITFLFPYGKDFRTGQASQPRTDCFEPEIVDLAPEDEDCAVHVLTPDDFERDWFRGGMSFGSLPGGLSRAPFQWHYRDAMFPMEFLGGFVGVAQDEATLALKPEIGWAVRENRQPA